MRKKEYPDLKGDSRPAKGWPKEHGAAGDRIPGLSAKGFGVLKFILGLMLLPFVWASAFSFLEQLSLIDAQAQNYFWSGAAAFLIIFLFIWEPEAIYSRGHRILEVIFSFFKPFVRIAPNILPIYSIILFFIYAVLSFTINDAWFKAAFLFLFGFSAALHIVFCAKSLRTKKSDYLKANYLFGFSFIFIINLMLFAFCFSLIFKEFSFVNFFNSAFQSAKNIFYAVFKQLFLR